MRFAYCDARGRAVSGSAGARHQPGSLARRQPRVLRGARPRWVRAPRVSRPSLGAPPPMAVGSVRQSQQRRTKQSFKNLHASCRVPEANAMKRPLTTAALMLAVVAGACGDTNNPVSPTRSVHNAPPPTAKLSGTMTVATSLTATGDYQCTTQIHLTESGGVAATVSKVELSRSDAWGPYPAFATFGAESWSGGIVIAANGTLASKVLVATEEMPTDYCYQLEARVRLGEGTGVSGPAVSIYADTPPIPQPPPTARFTLAGMVTQDGRNAIALSDVTVDVLSGANAGCRAPGRSRTAGTRLPVSRPANSASSFPGLATWPRAPRSILSRIERSTTT